MIFRRYSDQNSCRCTKGARVAINLADPRKRGRMWVALTRIWRNGRILPWCDRKCAAKIASDRIRYVRMSKLQLRVWRNIDICHWYRSVNARWLTSWRSSRKAESANSELVRACYFFRWFAGIVMRICGMKCYLLMVYETFAIMLWLTTADGFCLVNNDAQLQWYETFPVCRTIKPAPAHHQTSQIRNRLLLLVVEW